MYDKHKDHERRVAKLVGIFAESLGYDEDKVKSMSAAAVTHDCGKIFVREDILNKAGRLTESEFEKVKKHTVFGCYMLKELDQPGLAQMMALYHRERWDGTGYPKGLKGSHIPVEAQILSICDVYDALSEDREYNKGLPHHQVVKIILEGFGTQFNPKLENHFLKCCEKFNNAR